MRQRFTYLGLLGAKMLEALFWVALAAMAIQVSFTIVAWIITYIMMMVG